MNGFKAMADRSAVIITVASRMVHHRAKEGLTMNTCRLLLCSVMLCSAVLVMQPKLVSSVVLLKESAAAAQCTGRHTEQHRFQSKHPYHTHPVL